MLAAALVQIDHGLSKWGLAKQGQKAFEGVQTVVHTFFILGLEGSLHVSHFGVEAVQEGLNQLTQQELVSSDLTRLG